MKDIIRLDILGNIKLTLDSKEIGENISQKGLAILIYLASNSGRDISREKLSSLLWAESTEEAARYNLRYNFWTLRKSLKSFDKIIFGDKNICRLQASDLIVLDTEKFKEYLEDESGNRLENLEKAKGLYRGDFLDGFFLKDCLEFNDWVFFQKETYQRKYYHMIMELSHLYRKKLDYDLAIENLLELVKLNSLDEKVYIQLIDTYLEKGDRVSAFKVYYKCSEVLREELNISPSKETKEAYYRIQNYIEKDLNTDLKTCGKLEDPREENKYRRGNLKGRKIYLKTYRNPHKYYIITSLLKELLKIYEDFSPKDFNTNYLGDLYYLDSNVVKFLEAGSRPEERDLLDHKLYSSLYEFLAYILERESLSLIIDNIDQVDEISFKFLNMALSLVNKDKLSLETGYVNKSKRIEVL